MFPEKEFGGHYKSYEEIRSESGDVDAQGSGDIRELENEMSKWLQVKVEMHQGEVLRPHFF